MRVSCISNDQVGVTFAVYDAEVQVTLSGPDLDASKYAVGQDYILTVEGVVSLGDARDCKP